MISKIIVFLFTIGLVKASHKYIWDEDTSDGLPLGAHHGKATIARWPYVYVLGCGCHYPDVHKATISETQCFNLECFGSIGYF